MSLSPAARTALESARQHDGTFGAQPRTPAETTLPPAYVPGSGTAPDGYVFPELVGGLRPDEVTVRFFVVEHEPNAANRTGLTHHLEMSPVPGHEGSLTISTGAPPQGVEPGTTTLESAPAWARDYALSTYLPLPESDKRMKEWLRTAPHSDVRPAND